MPFSLAAAVSVQPDKAGDGVLSAQQLLKQMDEHSASMSYYGTLIYSQGKHMETLKLYHAVVDGKPYERLVHLSGKPRETLRQGDEVICLDASGSRTFGRDVPAGPFVRAFSDTVLSGNSAYTVALAGEGRVAGRRVIQVQLQPKDTYRYGFRLALDAETQLLLQSLMLDENNEVLERYEYSQITIGEPISPADLQPELPMVPESKPLAPSVDATLTADTDRSHSTTARVNTPVPQWRIGWVPEGFAAQRVGGEVSPLLLRAGRDHGLMFSDGLSAFTVFVADKVNLGNRSRRSGATTAHTVVKSLEGSVFSVTVVGEVSRLAAQKVAQSVEPAQ